MGRLKKVMTEEKRKANRRQYSKTYYWKNKSKVDERVKTYYRKKKDLRDLQDHES